MSLCYDFLVDKRVSIMKSNLTNGILYILASIAWIVLAHYSESIFPDSTIASFTSVFVRFLSIAFFFVGLMMLVTYYNEKKKGQRLVRKVDKRRYRREQEALRAEKESKEK